MKVYSKTEEKWLDVQPVVDVNTNKVIGFKKEGDNEILSPDLFVCKEPIDWDRVLIEGAFNIFEVELSHLSINTCDIPSRAEQAVDAAREVVIELRKLIKL